MRAVLVLSTAPDLKSASRIARVLIAKRAAACVTVLPDARSRYRWKGKTENTRECVLLIKTSRERLKTLAKALAAVHPYETPEILAFPASLVSKAYGRWMREVL